MGMGEPAHNLDNVLEAIDLLGTDGGIGHKNLVFSTVGDARVFERLPQGRVKPALALSLHTTKADLRRQLWPARHGGAGSGRAARRDGRRRWSGESWSRAKTHASAGVAKPSGRALVSSAFQRDRGGR